jgi:Asp-tRNA(Asn)/Glu-tRNA(Gln) amidotransferase A subunit family amidase
MISPVLAYSGFPAEMLQVPTEQGGIGYTPVWNQTGNPAASICCGFDADKGLPIGLQIIGQRFDDLGVLQLAAAYERIRGFEMHWPD